MSDQAAAPSLLAAKGDCRSKFFPRYLQHPFKMERKTLLRRYEDGLKVHMTHDSMIEQ